MRHITYLFGILNVFQKDITVANGIEHRPFANIIDYMSVPIVDIRIGDTLIATGDVPVCPVDTPRWVIQPELISCHKSRIYSRFTIIGQIRITGCQIFDRFATHGKGIIYCGGIVGYDIQIVAGLKKQ
ncbi:hypothetical protein D3C81_1417660 [compost metagenome]